MEPACTLGVIAELLVELLVVVLLLNKFGKHLGDIVDVVLAIDILLEAEYATG